MKKILLAIMLCLTPTLVASTITKLDIIKTVEHQRQLVHEAERQASTAKAELLVVQEAINTQTAKLHDTESRLAVTIKERDSALHHLNLLLLIASTAIAFFVSILSLQFVAFLPPQWVAYKLMIVAGVGIAAEGIAWAILGHL